jgi:hypothetical protein
MKESETYGWCLCSDYSLSGEVVEWWRNVEVLERTRVGRQTRTLRKGWCEGIAIDARTKTAIQICSVENLAW